MFLAHSRTHTKWPNRALLLQLFTLGQMASVFFLLSFFLVSACPTHLSHCLRNGMLTLEACPSLKLFLSLTQAFKTTSSFCNCSIQNFAISLNDVTLPSSPFMSFWPFLNFSLLSSCRSDPFSSSCFCSALPSWNLKHSW